MKIHFSTILSLLFLLSCSEGMQKKYYRLEDLRILAMITDNPEVNSVQAITVTPIISYPDGGSTTLDISYEGCLDPGITYGEELDCDKGIADTRVSGTYTYNTSNLGTNSNYTGAVTPFSFTLPAINFVLLNSLTTKAAFNGIDYLIYITVIDQNNSSQEIEVLKRIKLSSKTSGLNTNPTITGTIQADGVNLTSYPSSKVELTVGGLSDPESYELETDVGLETIEENMQVTWFTNAGSLQYTRSVNNDPNEYDPRSNSGGTIVAIYRDNRGGITYKILSL
ncbi:hypothetical protein N9N67_11225 [Bacteriovoracaceae bacterium]|nr:hypothetical protein [Bacteriovoracaceae bacterium]